MSGSFSWVKPVLSSVDKCLAGGHNTKLPAVRLDPGTSLSQVVHSTTDSHCAPQNVMYNTVKPVLSSHSKIDKTKVLKTNGSLMKVESIAECSWSILQYI